MFQILLEESDYPMYIAITTMIQRFTGHVSKGLCQTAKQHLLIGRCGPIVVECMYVLKNTKKNDCIIVNYLYALTQMLYSQFATAH